MDTLLPLCLFLACLPKAVMCASRDLRVQAVCVFMWSLLRREGIISKLFCHLLLLLCFITAQEIQVNTSIVSECIVECL